MPSATTNRYLGYTGWDFLFYSSCVIAVRFKLHWALLWSSTGIPQEGKQENWKKCTAAGAVELTRGSAAPWAAVSCSSGSIYSPSVLLTHHFWQGQLCYRWHLLSLHCCLSSTILSSSLRTRMESVLKRKMYTKIQQIAKCSLVAEYSPIKNMGFPLKTVLCLQFTNCSECHEMLNSLLLHKGFGFLQRCNIYF